MEEIRKDIPWYNWYQASNMWGIKKKWLLMTWCSKKSKTLYNKYCSVRIMWKNIKVHYLVMLTFAWKKPEWYVIDHINEKKYDNRLENLEYVTISTNVLRAKINKTKYLESCADKILASGLWYKY